jgi:hypothetical protein
MSVITIPRIDVPIAGSEKPTRDFYRWMSDVTERIGGVIAPTNNELAASDFDDAGVEELKHESAKAFDALMQTPPVVEVRVEQLETQFAVLMAAVAELAKELDGLKQGVAQ